MKISEPLWNEQFVRVLVNWKTRVPMSICGTNGGGQCIAKLLLMLGMTIMVARRSCAHTILKYLEVATRKSITKECSGTRAYRGVDNELPHSLRLARMICDVAV